MLIHLILKHSMSAWEKKSVKTVKTLPEIRIKNSLIIELCSIHSIIEKLGIKKALRLRKSTL